MARLHQLLFETASKSGMVAEPILSTTPHTWTPRLNGAGSRGIFVMPL
jgi:hypothetical protein